MHSKPARLAKRDYTLTIFWDQGARSAPVFWAQLWFSTPEPLKKDVDFGMIDGLAQACPTSPPELVSRPPPAAAAPVSSPSTDCQTRISIAPSQPDLGAEHRAPGQDAAAALITMPYPVLLGRSASLHVEMVLIQSWHLPARWSVDPHHCRLDCTGRSFREDKTPSRDS